MAYIWPYHLVSRVALLFDICSVVLCVVHEEDPPTSPAVEQKTAETGQVLHYFCGVPSTKPYYASSALYRRGPEWVSYLKLSRSEGIALHICRSSSVNCLGFLQPIWREKFGGHFGEFSGATRQGPKAFGKNSQLIFRLKILNSKPHIFVPTLFCKSATLIQWGIEAIVSPIAVSCNTQLFHSLQSVPTNEAFHQGRHL